MIEHECREVVGELVNYLNQELLNGWFKTWQLSFYTQAYAGPQVKPGEQRESYDVEMVKGLGPLIDTIRDIAYPLYFPNNTKKMMALISVAYSAFMLKRDNISRFIKLVRLTLSIENEVRDLDYAK